MFKKLAGIQLVLVCLLLSGCANLAKSKVTSESQSSVKVNENVPGPETKVQDENPWNQCEGTLNVLKAVNSEKYFERKGEFDHLMSGATEYAGVRANINEEMQSTLDSLYRYKVGVLCAKITQDVMQDLVRQVEMVK